MEGSAIVVGGREGAIVRGNTIHNFFNGIYTGRWGELENTAIAFEALFFPCRKTSQKALKLTREFSYADGIKGDFSPPIA